MSHLDPPSPLAPPAGLSAVCGIVLLTGPSGSGKSSLAARCGLPAVCLDDFYRDGDDPGLPTCDLGIVDWDDPASWDADRALATLIALATDGVADVPIYDIPSNGALGSRTLDLAGAPLVVAEGIFAAELVERCRQAGILADALCLVQPPLVTFWRRLVRDLRERRKPPLTLLRRGLRQLRDEPDVVAAQVAQGTRPVSGEAAERRLAALLAGTRTDTAAIHRAA